MLWDDWENTVSASIKETTVPCDDKDPVSAIVEKLCEKNFLAEYHKWTAFLPL